MNFDLEKYPITVIAGFLVIVIYCTFTFISWALFPTQFSPFDNYLSDLGNSSFNPNGAIFFNLGNILTGCALFPFFLGLYKWYRNELWHKILGICVQLIGFFSAFVDIMLGIFSEDFMAPHMFWTEIFFGAILFVLLFGSVFLLFHKDFIRPIAIYGFIVAIIDLIFVFFIFAPIIEWFVVFTLLGYVGLIIFNMYRKVRQP
jgi:hypothetical membrane protein